MKIRFPFLLSLLAVLIYGINSGTIYASKNDKPDAYEKIFPEMGYKTVHEAKRDFEHHFNQKLKLPLRVPPITFTHHFGRFNNLDGDINDSFNMVFISDISPENHFKIDVRPVKHKITLKDKYVLQVYNLKNGNEAKYMNFSGFNLLVFERDNWQYIFSVDKRVSDKVTPETLVQIANSIDYSAELNKRFFQ
ncbi:hypothetical protein [Neobacillus sp. YIM B06451]|uniref:hypothetical protein n=1 Tax=Neobacillus sp. YIM B06451 TaxID=3070994 RepID=UPI00292F1515|nr:hypothetical protein [Neobacillus sp. YIM B06451]